MGVLVKVGQNIVRPRDYKISESSTPLAGGDGSGGVGTLEFEINPVERPYLMHEQNVQFFDTAKGSTNGKVRLISDSRDAGHRITANSRLGAFMVEKQIKPFSGTLEGAFQYYCGLVNITTEIFVAESIRLTPVDFIGFSGNLWFHMKQMAIGIGADLNLVSNVVILRPIRGFEAIVDRDINSEVTLDASSLAQKQEVIWYDTQRIASGLLYPPGGWNSEVRPLSVNAGETIEVTLELQSSATSIYQPVPVTSIGPYYTSSSVYTVVGDDNLPIQPAQWVDYGGSVIVSIKEDTRSLGVKITGAQGLFQSNGSPMKVFRLALSSGQGGSPYSTLRIVGDAIHLNKQSLILSTTVEPSRTAQEFAPTIDNTFINNIESAYSAGIRGARRHAGRQFSLSSSVVAINKRGETGQAAYPAYSNAQTLWGGSTYGARKSAFAGKSYAVVKSDLFVAVRDNFDNQLFGNVAGARIRDRKSARIFRVRDATTQWGNTSIEADDDLTIGDMQKHFNGKTYGQIKIIMRMAGSAGVGYGQGEYGSSDYGGSAQMTYLQANLMGMIK